MGRERGSYLDLVKAVKTMDWEGGSTVWACLGIF